MTFQLTPRQVEANQLLGSAARHILLFGGSRSGKTFLILRAVVTRALAIKSRHACLRYRFNHIKASLVYDTLPKMMELCFPGVAERSHLDKSDWFYKLPNDSEIWFGGLDDKERTEKILGQEYATIYLNECSQIPWASRNIAMTRLAQKTDLRLKAYYDCNPPSDTHWTCRAFVQRLDPDTRIPLRDKENYASLTINPADNQANLPAEYLQELQALPERMRRRFLLGEWGSASDNALWTFDLLDRCRMLEGQGPEMRRIIVAVDPSGCSGDEDTRSDEIGIVVAGLGADGKAYLLEDLSGRMGPAEWGRAVVAAYSRHLADAVVAETNFGGAMVAEVVRSARAADNPDGLRIPVREVTASRGKAVRAEPISALYHQGKVVHVGFFERLEDQLCAMTTAGYTGTRSPDRADALVWALSELFPALTRKPKTGMAGGERLPIMANRGYAHLK